MLKNGTFTKGWSDVHRGGRLVQQPKGWLLSCVPVDSALYDSSDKATGIAECVHKLASQLPPNEQRGAKDALILVGDTTYKIFGDRIAFGAELRQTITGLAPGTQAELTVPILAVLHGETDPYGAESGVWVVSDEWEWDAGGSWVNGGVMGNRKWYKHVRYFTVPRDGRVEVVIRVKSKYENKKDFFIDGITLGAIAAPTQPPAPVPPAPAPEPPPAGPDWGALHQDLIRMQAHLQKMDGILSGLIAAVDEEFKKRG